MRFLLAAMFLVAASSTVFAIDPAVRDACTNDYFRHCSHTDPGSAECKSCFRKAGMKLSHNCRSAIKNSSEYASEYTKAKKRYKSRHIRKENTHRYYGGMY